MASISDKITKVKDGSNPNVARVVTPRPANSDTLSVDSLTGWTEDTAVHFMTYRVDSTGKVVPGSQRDWKGMANKSTGQIISLQIQNNAIDDGNLVGDIVQAGPTASWAQDLAEAMLESHKSDGSLKKGAVGAENIAKDSIVAESIKEKSITADKIDFTTMPLAEKVKVKRNDITTDKPVNVQCGCARILVSANASEAIANIQFPKQFKSGTFPVVVCTFAGYTPNSGDAWTDTPLDTWGGASMSALKITNSSFKATIRRFDGAWLNGVYYFNWIAIGQQTRLSLLVAY